MLLTAVQDTVEEPANVVVRLALKAFVPPQTLAVNVDVIERNVVTFPEPECVAFTINPATTPVIFCAQESDTTDSAREP